MEANPGRGAAGHSSFCLSPQLPFSPPWLPWSSPGRRKAQSTVSVGTVMSKSLQTPELVFQDGREKKRPRAPGPRPCHGLSAFSFLPQQREYIRKTEGCPARGSSRKRWPPAVQSVGLVLGLVQTFTSDSAQPLLPSSRWSSCQTCRQAAGHPPAPGSHVCSNTWVGTRWSGMPSRTPTLLPPPPMEPKSPHCTACPSGLYLHLTPTPFSPVVTMLA